MFEGVYFTVETLSADSWKVYAEKLNYFDATTLFHQLLCVDAFGVRLTCDGIDDGEA